MDKRIEITALDIGEGMLISGAEVFRVEDTIKRILTSKGIKDCNIFCISSVIIISDKNGTFSRRINESNIDLSRLEGLNAKSRDICKGIKTEYNYEHYKKALQFICVIIATGSFCLYFGGGVTDAFVSGIIGIIINFRKTKIKISFSDTFFDSLISGLLAGIITMIFPSLHYDKIMIGAIMLLVPGLTITSAIRDVMLSDFISGITELFDALFVAVAISLGCASSLVVINCINRCFA